jgi:hypothetical protein
VTRTILGFGWLIYGYSIFFDPLAFDYGWARGELGDYIGGLGGISVLFIVYTLWKQVGQINSQQNESYEAGVFRIFEALKPELEGLSVRIVSKLLKAKIVSEDGEEPFIEMLKKYRGGDRTVFLRALQKSKYCHAIRLNHEDEELVKSINRFKNIMALLDKSLKETVINDDDDGDFSRAIKSTEIYATYDKCFENILK